MVELPRSVTFVSGLRVGSDRGQFQVDCLEKYVVFGNRKLQGALV
jgi:hypothetical protein